MRGNKPKTRRKRAPRAAGPSDRRAAAGSDPAGGASAARNFSAIRLAVIGDIVLDRYVWGEVSRISPEAPVPVVLQARRSEVPGGALNVARNVAAAGARAEMVGVTGRDAEGARILELMDEIGLATRSVVPDPGRPTTVKTRIIAGGQQLLRLDQEEAGGHPAAVENKLITAVRRAIRTCDGVILSDYRKGVLTPRVIATAIAEARRNGVPVVVDPKSDDFSIYKGADWLTPNLREAAGALGGPGATPDPSLGTNEGIEAAGRALIRRYGGRGIVITRGKDGASLIGRGGPLHVPARAREVFDVTGAGDTFIAHFTLGLAAGLTPGDAVVIGNAAAGVAVTRVGAVTVSPAELAAALGDVPGASAVREAGDLAVVCDRLHAEGRRIVFTNGCFDLFHAGHVRLLHEARALGDVLIVALNTDASVRRIKGHGRPIMPAEERAAVMSAVAGVDYVVFFDEDTPETLLERLRPDVLVKGRSDRDEPVVGADGIRARGGEVVELPLYEATSTGELVRKIRRREEGGGGSKSESKSKSKNVNGGG